MDEVFRDGDYHLGENVQELLTSLRALTGTTNTPVDIKRSDQHGAATDMKMISLGQNYVSWTLPQNYHGFPSEYIAAGVAFTVAHEIGHITVHPGRVSDWKAEVRDLPVDAHEQFDWSNVISDIIVNFNVSRGNNFIEDTAFGREMIKTLSYGHFADSFFRICGTPYSDESGRQALARVLQNGQNSYGQPVEDNRYIPPASTGLIQGDFNPGESGNASIATAETPLFQQLMGYGRGPQIYPPVSWCIQNDNPDTGQPFPNNWNSVEIASRITSHYCSSCSQYQGFQTTAGVCEICSEPTVIEGTFTPGIQVVEAAMTYDNRTSFDGFEPIMAYRINGKWIPARYCREICPDTGLPAKQTYGYWFNYRGLMGEAQQRNGFEVRFLLVMEWAANYSTRPEGYGGKKGDDAAYQWLQDVSYTLHASTLEAGGVGINEDLAR